MVKSKGVGYPIGKKFSIFSYIVTLKAMTLICLWSGGELGHGGDLSWSLPTAHRSRDHPRLCEHLLRVALRPSSQSKNMCPQARFFLLINSLIDLRCLPCVWTYIAIHRFSDITIASLLCKNSVFQLRYLQSWENFLNGLYFQVLILQAF